RHRRRRPLGHAQLRREGAGRTTEDLPVRAGPAADERGGDPAMVTRALPARDDALRLLRERFLNRTDLVAILAPWGKPCPVEANGTLDDLLLGHLLGGDAPEAKVKYANR